MAEALREAKDGLGHATTPPLMNAYIATQAAISSSLYESNPVDYFKTQGRSWTHDETTPVDALAHFPAINPFGNSNDKPYMDGTQQFCANWINFYNEGDYAVGDNTSFLVNTHNQSSWEYNNTHNRPWQGALLLMPWESRSSFGFDTQLNLFHESWKDDNGQYQNKTLDPSDPNDRYKILCFAAQSYGVAVGGGQVDSFFRVGNTNKNVNLGDEPFNFGQSRQEHSGQFYYNIQLRWPYWQQVLASFKLPHNEWSR